jgi:phage gp46-like protein
MTVDPIYTDLVFELDSDGIYDLALDTDTRDMALIDGLESAIMVSLFSDRRAADDEVVDPLKRRGWIGDLVSEVPGDRHGSGLWLYEQRRLSEETIVGLKNEAEASLRWMLDEGLVTTVEASVVPDPAHRSVTLVIKLGSPQGGQTIRKFTLADKTRRRAITNQ